MDDLKSKPNNASEFLIDGSLRTGGRVVGPVAEAEQPLWARSFLKQYRDARQKTGCPHLETGSATIMWSAGAPDLICCPQCLPELQQRIEDRLGKKLTEGPSECSVCRKQGPVRGVSLTAGNILLRGSICSACESYEHLRMDEEAFIESSSFDDVRILGIPPFRIDEGALEQADSLTDFDHEMDSMLDRSRALAVAVADSVNAKLLNDRTGLSLDEATVGGLLVRIAKLLGGIIDSVDTGHSESHSPLSRSAAETAITIRWLIKKNSADSFRRFRGDSFVQWRKWTQESAENDFSSEERRTREPMDNHIANELEAAGLTWDEVPAQANSWGPDARQRFEAFDQGWIYEWMFVTHSNYVHPSWHEVRAFHIRTDPEGMRLDPVHAEMSASAAFVLARLIIEATADVAHYLPNELDLEALDRVAERTVHVSQILSVAFADFVDRGGLEGNLKRHVQ